MKQNVIVNLQDSHITLFGYSDLGVWAKSKPELDRLMQAKEKKETTRKDKKQYEND